MGINRNRKQSPSQTTMAAKTKQYVITATQFLIWYIANSLYAVDAQKFLQSFRSNFLIIDLSLCQILVGILIAQGIKWYNSHHSQPHTSDSTPSTNSFFTLVTLIGLLHLSATTFTNSSYRVIGSTSTLAWKLTEPFAAIILKRLILHQSIHPISFLGVICIVIGVVTFSINALNVIALSPILLANLLFPLRNVFIKLHQKTHTTHISTDHRFLLILTSCLPFCLIIYPIKLAFEAPIVPAIPFILRNAILFNVYQFASIALLEKLDALTHSLANTVKRVLGIALSAALLHESLTSNHLAGLLLATVGFLLYAFGGKANLRTRALIFCTLILILLFTYQTSWNDSGDISKRAYVRESNGSSKTIRDRQIDKLNSPQTPHTDFILHIARKQDFEESYKSHVNKSNILSYRGANTGNLVWRQAAYEKVVDLWNVRVCNETTSACVTRVSSLRPSRMVFYMPESTLFDARRKPIFQYHSHIFKQGGIVLVIGAGIQAYFGKEIEDIRNREEHRRLAVEKYRFPGGLSFLALQKKASTPMLVRGNFTKTALQREGYPHAISAGCPSIFLNENVRLGEMMEEKYERLRERIGDKSLKVGINLALRIPRLVEVLLNLFREYPNSLIFAQTNGDGAVLSSHHIDPSRVRLYANVTEWGRSLSEMDVVIGGRLHGSMLALGVSVPIFIIAPDYRVLELVERMKIPHMTAYDARLDNDTFDVAKLVGENGINGKEFDENRCGIAKIYRQVFARFGFRVSSHLRQISEIC